MASKYLQLVKDNVFPKIVKIFRNIFNKKNIKILDTDISVKNENKKNQFLENIKIENEGNSERIILQERVENYEIDLKSLCIDELDDLNLLYDKQIDDLNKKLNEKRIERDLLIKKLNNIS